MPDQPIPAAQPIARVDSANAVAPSRAGSVATVLAWASTPPRPRDLALALLLAAPVPLIMALMPYVVLNYTHHDVFIPLDAAWRTLQGQWPHTDFYTPLGLTYFWQHGAAAWLWGMDGRVAIRANFVALPFVILPALLLAWRRLNASNTILFTMLLTVLVTAPTFIDGPERLIAHLANYNRVGTGLCALVCLWALCPPRTPSAAWDVAEAVALGVLMVMLLYLKLTFFALALAIVIAGCATVGRFWWRAVIAGLVMLAGVALLELVHSGLLVAYLADLRRAGTANTQLFRGFYAPQALVSNLLPCMLIVVLGGIVAWIAPRQLWGLMGIAGVMVACVLVSTQSFGAFSPPLVVLVMLLAQRMAVAGGMADPSVAGLRVPDAGPLLAMAGVFVVLLAAVPFLLTQTAGTVYQTTLKPAKGVVVGDGRSDTLRTLVWIPNPIERAFVPDSFTPEEGVKWHAVLPVTVANAILTDGLDLLRRDGLSQRRIANLSFNNPFPVAFRAPSPRGGALWWDTERTFTQSSVSPAMVLGDAEVVMVPRLWWSYADVSDLLTVVQDELDRNFTRHDSTYWTAWERR